MPVVRSIEIRVYADAHYWNCGPVYNCWLIHYLITTIILFRISQGNNTHVGGKGGKEGGKEERERGGS